MLELVRYIHLNPLRAKIVNTLTESEKNPYNGHSALMGKLPREFQDTDPSKKLGVSQPSVSISVKRGEKIARAGQLKLVEE